MRNLTDLMIDNPSGKQLPMPATAQTSAGQPISSIGTDHAQAVAAVFAVMNRAFPRKFASIWPLPKDVEASKREWLLAFADCGHLTAQTLEIGLRAVRTLDWPPDNPGEFLKLCRIAPEMIGAPAAHEAFAEACQHTGAGTSVPWSHKCVYRAAMDIGLGVIERKGWVAEMDFSRAYQRALNIHHALPEAPTAELPAPPVEPAAPDFVAGCLAKVRAGLAAVPVQNSGDIKRPREYLIGEFMGARTIARDFRHVPDLREESLTRMASARTRLLAGEYL